MVLVDDNTCRRLSPGFAGIGQCQDAGVGRKMQIMFILTVRDESTGTVTVAVTVLYHAGRAGGEIVKMPGIGCRTVRNHAILTVNLLSQIACAAPGNRRWISQRALFGAKEGILATEND